MAQPIPQRPSAPALPASGAPAPGPPRPSVADAVDVYQRTYNTILRSSGETRLRVLEATHRAMGSSLHPLADSEELDLGAFLYAARRLPDALHRTEVVVLGQSADAFAAQGLGSLDEWTEVSAPGRRRRWYHDGRRMLAVLIASESDVDDLVPTLVAFQVEWNKLHLRVRGAGGTPPGLTAAELSGRLSGRQDDWEQLLEVWGHEAAARLADVSSRRLSLRIRMLGGTQVGYARVTRRWWQQVTGLVRSEGLVDRPVYFVSSNAHSLANLLTGISVRREAELVRFVDEQGSPELRDELQRFRDRRTEGSWSNFLYYVTRVYQQALASDSPERAAMRREERDRGVMGVHSRTAVDIAAQVMPIDRLDPTCFDDRLGDVDAAALRASRAVVVNIDYPLGLAAYNILREVAETVSALRGVYVLGKAATLNADVGDVMISGVIHDEHSGTTYWLDNAFSVQDIAPYLRFGSGLDNQRAVTVKGTFLQNRGYLDYYYREAFTVVEMEAGPYCSAVYELSEAGRYPTGEPVSFSRLPIDFGIIHYASDTPFTQARTLGARGLSYYGMDSTYAASVAILRRILQREGALSATPSGPRGEPWVTPRTGRAPSPHIGEAHDP